MFSPSKSFAYLAQKESQNLISFKQETLMLLRQQSQKIRELKALLSTKDEELMIKEEQIKFLKETIRELESEDQVLIQEKNELKLKLEKIIEEVKIYNLNVVKPICEQKEHLKKANQSLKTTSEALQKSLSQNQHQLQESQEKLKSVVNQLEKSKIYLKQQQIKYIELERKLEKQSLSSTKHIEQVLKISNQLNLQSSKRSKFQTEVSALNKQLSSLVIKYNSSIKEYEIKISQIQQNKIDVSEILVYQELVKTKQQENVKIKTQMILLTKSNEETKHKYLSEKEKWMKESTELKIKLAEITTDLMILKKSIELDKKIAEFQSESSDIFYPLFQKYSNLNETYSELLEKHEQLTSQNQKLSRDVQRLSQRLKDCQIEQTLMKTQLQQELQRLESTYEGKLVSLNLKIRKEEEALDRLKKRELQAMEDKESLCHQLDIVHKDYSSYKQTTEKSLEKLNAQNYRIVNQMQELYKICQENVDNKRVVDKIKHVIHALLTGLYYFQFQIFLSKQKQRKIYLPLVDSYIKISQKLKQIERKFIEQDQSQSQEKQFMIKPSKQQHNLQNQNLKPKQNSKSLRKFRIAVYVVLGSLRISKKFQGIEKGENSISLSGAQRKLLKALSTRNKINNMSHLMEKEAQAYTKHEQPEQILITLLQNTEKAFTWSEANFKHLNVNEYRHLSILTRIQQIVLKAAKSQNQKNQKEQ